MVKNVKGGSQHKKFAKKNFTKENAEQKKTRLMNPKEPCEMYANVIKLFGQGMCEVRCNDGVNRMCVIRNKFRGKNRQQNMIYVDCKVLIGIRDWELVKDGKLSKCDLLEVYERKQFMDIKNDPQSNWVHLMGESDRLGYNSGDGVGGGGIGGGGGDALYEFCDDTANTRVVVTQEKSQEQGHPITEQDTQDDDNDERINIDDI